MKTAVELRLEAEQKAANLKRILVSPDGVELLKLLDIEFADRTSHVAGDPHTTAFNEGQRSVVLFLRDIKETEYEIELPETT